MTSISPETLSELTSIRTDREVEFDWFGFIDDLSGTGVLSFLDEERYLRSALDHPSLSVLITNSRLANRGELKKKECQILVSDQPRYDFGKLFNYFSQRRLESRSTEIDPTASIGEGARIADTNVEIGPDVRIEPNTTVLKNVKIGAGATIRANAVIGSSGFELKSGKNDVINLYHDDYALIGENVEIGSGSIVSRSFSLVSSTHIQRGVIIDNRVHIGHGVCIGEQSQIAACAHLSGGVELGEEVQIGPGSMIANKCSIGDRARVTIGSVVVEDIPEEETRTGNFARPHTSFMEEFMEQKRKDMDHDRN